MNKKDTILSVGFNRKLGKRIGVFNLPEGKTCPNATPLCRQICYALKAGRMYKSAAAKRLKNLNASLSPTFVAEFVAEVKARKLTMVRFHESGDVYNQDYLNKIFAIATSLPEVKFLLYSKSFHLDWSGMPANISRYWSVDKTTPTQPPAGNRAYLLTREEGKELPFLAKTCAHKSKAHYCGTECLICWEGKSEVYFPQH